MKKDVYERYIGKSLKVSLKSGIFFYGELIAYDDNLLHFCDRLGIESSIAPTEIVNMRTLEHASIGSNDCEVHNGSLE